MSKAFIKETDDEKDSDLGSSPDQLPPTAKNYMTPQGARALHAELETLMKKERPKILETIAWAASNGDRSENGDYIYGKRRLREIDRRIRYLNKRIDKLEIIDPTTQNSPTVLFGATVTVINEEGNELVYKIVGIDETEPSAGKISWVSPIGKALLQSRVGDVVTFLSPRGEVELEITGLAYLSIE